MLLGTRHWETASSAVGFRMSYWKFLSKALLGQQMQTGTMTHTCTCTYTHTHNTHMYTQCTHTVTMHTCTLTTHTCTRAHTPLLMHIHTTHTHACTHTQVPSDTHATHPSCPSTLSIMFQNKHFSCLHFGHTLGARKVLTWFHVDPKE
jgi:hypothetical protein